MPKGQGSTNFPQRGLACAGRAAGTLFPEWADAELFRFLSYNTLFISREMILLWYVQGPPSLPHPHLNRQQSPGKLPRETPVSYSVRMVPCFCLWQLQSDSSRQRFTTSSKTCFIVVRSFILEDLLFNSRYCKATMCTNATWSPERASCTPGLLFLSFLFLFFWGGPWDAVGRLRLRTPSLRRAYGPLDINDVIESLGKF